MEKIFYEKILYRMSEAVFLLDSSGTFLFSNHKGEEMFRTLPGKLKGKNFNDFFSEPVVSRFLRTIKIVLGRGETIKREIETRIDGIDYIIDITITGFDFEEDFGKNVVLCTANDVTKDRKEKVRFNNFEHFMNFSSQGFVVLNMAWEIIYANPAFCKILKFNTASECYLKKISDYYSLNSRKKFEDRGRTSLEHSGKWSGELALYDTHGQEILTAESYFIIKDKNGRPKYYANIVADISDKKMMQGEILKYQQNLEKLIEERTEQLLRLNTQLNDLYIQLTEASIRDPLTELYNRSYVNQFLKKTMTELNWNHFIKIDIDRFGEINQEYGYEVGDRVLKKIAKLIKDLFGLEALCARFDSNAFLVMVNMENDVVMRLADTLRTKVKMMPLCYENAEFYTSVSLGIYYSVMQTENIANAIKMAARMLYKAKTQGTNQVEYRRV
ncbi:MAG: sensor domain-containing diguanylate cyclase [Fusobacteria bacterium]|nr:sensor domain-containing diguanylate cyclase [Fusobacteriota bacterium]